MELSKQVVSLELAKKLKELGVEQGDWDSESPVWYWSTYDGGNTDKKPGLIPYTECNYGFMEDLIAAFTVAELIKMFPRYVTIQIRNNRPDETRLMIEIEQKWFQEDGGTTADTLATMLIYLIENKLISPTN